AQFAMVIHGATGPTWFSRGTAHTKTGPVTCTFAAEGLICTIGVRARHSIRCAAWPRIILLSAHGVPSRGAENSPDIPGESPLGAARAPTGPYGGPLPWFMRHERWRRAGAGAPLKVLQLITDRDRRGAQVFALDLGA